MSRRLHLMAFALLLTLALGVFIYSRVPVVAQDFGTGPWFAQYFNATNFTNPVGTASYTALNLFSAGVPTNASGQPITGVGADNFSVRFTSTQNFQAGTYLFRVNADDQATLLIDNVQVLTTSNPNIEAQAFVILTAGAHTLQVDVVEFAGNAAIQVQWGLQGGVATPGIAPTFGPAPTLGPTPIPTRTPLPAIAPGALAATVIRASVLNVRDAPSLGGNRIARIRRSETYAVVGRDERARWFLLELGGYQGWAYGYYLAFNFNEFTAPVVSGNVLLGLAGFPDTGVRIQTEAGLRLRALPTTASEQTGRITWGAFLPVVGRTADNQWLQVVWRGTPGWVFAPFVEIRAGDLNNVPIR
ncbi:MAG: SH3 domain-containing protein [bacterium]|nr:SH3 domain-containing protein [bacterium]